MGIGILLNILGFGKTIMNWIWDAIKGICAWIVANPVKALIVAIALALAASMWHSHNLSNDLDAANKTIESKNTFIKEQGDKLNKYVKALDAEKTSHQDTIHNNNKAVDSLKKMADEALAEAQKAGRRALTEKKRYDEMAGQFGQANPTSGTPAERIEREENTNDAFIKSWRDK
jgi:septal ring factor EnvC (AmiA/AmiB activator)